MDPAPKGQCLLILGGPSSFIQTKFHQEVAQILAKMEVFLGEFHRTRLFPAPQEHSGLPFLSSLKVVVTVRMLGMSLLSPYQPQAADIPTHKLPLKDIKPFTLSQTLHPHVIPCVQPARNSPGLPDQSLSPPSWALGFLSVPPTSTIPHPQAPYPSRLSPLATPSTQTLGLPTPSTRADVNYHVQGLLKSIPLLFAPGCIKSEHVFQGTPALSYCPSQLPHALLGLHIRPGLASCC